MAKKIVPINRYLYLDELLGSFSKSIEPKKAVFKNCFSLLTEKSAYVFKLIPGKKYLQWYANFQFCNIFYKFLLRKAILRILSICVYEHDYENGINMDEDRDMTGTQIMAQTGTRTRAWPRSSTKTRTGTETGTRQDTDIGPYREMDRDRERDRDTERVMDTEGDTDVKHRCGYGDMARTVTWIGTRTRTLTGTQMDRGTDTDTDTN
jgi:hypothetical protein